MHTVKCPHRATLQTRALLLLPFLLFASCSPWSQREAIPHPVERAGAPVTSTFNKVDAENAFSAAQVLWKDNYQTNNAKFWQFGNALHSLIRFLAVVKQRNIDPAWVETNQGAVSAMVSKGHQYFFVDDPQKRINGLWVDDFGWWGLMFLAADDTLPGTGANYVQWAEDCWSRINKLCQGSGEAIPGGCWNHDKTGGGVQNSITNSLYLTLSVRLYRETGNAQTYLPAIARSTAWFLQWIDTAQDFGKCPATTSMAGAKTWLVRNTFDPIDTSQTYPWAVQLPEQAILFAGLSDFEAIDLPSSAPGVDPKIIAQLKELQRNEVKGLLGKLSTNWHRFFTTANVLQVPPFAFTFSSADDMVVGKGPFLRYALEAEAALAAQGTDLTPNYQPTADAAWATSRKGLMGPDWVQDKAVLAAFANGFYASYTSGGPAPASCELPHPQDSDWPFLTPPWDSYGFGPSQDNIAAMTEQTLGLDAMAAAMAHW